jgi:hypothetical protein
MQIKQLALAGVISLTLTSTAFADGIPQTVDELTEYAETLEARIATLEALLSNVTRGADPQTGQDTLQFSAMNVQIVNGNGYSDERSVPNGTGNLIIGYNEPNTTGQPNERTGSHMLVVGFGQNYTGFGGIVAGADNTTRGAWSSVLGGTENTASGSLSAISAGFRNSADSFATSVSGGRNNTAIGRFSSISGGLSNRTEGAFSTVSGGSDNTVLGEVSSILGGIGNEVSGYRATIAGGQNNFVGGYAATVSGGFDNGSYNDHSTVSGGRNNSAVATAATVSSGQFKSATSEGCAAGDSVPDSGSC